MQVENLHSLAIPEEDILMFSGKVIAKNVPYEDYLSGKYGIHVEWIYGVVIAMSPVGRKHNRLDQLLLLIFRTYLDMTNAGGEVLHDPFVMKPNADLPGRQPDIQVVLPDRLHMLKENEMAGPANLVVEIISPESSKRDRGDKYDEYEKGGVQEYWILDPIRKETFFYLRGEDGLFHIQLPVDGIYTSSVLPKLKLQVDLLWQENLPTISEIIKLVEELLKAGES